MLLGIIIFVSNSLRIGQNLQNKVSMERSKENTGTRRSIMKRNDHSSCQKVNADLLTVLTLWIELDLLPYSQVIIWHDKSFAIRRITL